MSNEAEFDVTEVEMDDDFYIQVTDIVDQEDGSAVMSVELSRHMLKTFAQIGLLKVLTEAAEAVLAAKTYSEGASEAVAEDEPTLF